MAVANSIVFTTAGTTLAVSAAPPASYDFTGYGALTYTPVSELVDLGVFGKVYNLVTHMAVGTRVTTKRKGAYNNGKMTLMLGRNLTDAGQAALVAGRDSDVSRSFLVTLQNGTRFYFTAQVMQFNIKLGNVDTIVGAECVLEIDSADILEQ